MDTPDKPQIYLVTPPVFDPEAFAPQLARVLDGVEIACIRLSLATRDEDTLSRAADSLRELSHVRDIALVMDSHVLLAQRLGLDGVHLTDGARSVRKVRTDLGEDAIVGAFCGASRHDGLTAGEAGADYVSFGPVGASTLGDGTAAQMELFEWWSEVIELPVVAEGALSVEDVRRLAPVTDFFAFGEEVWTSEDPLDSLRRLIAGMEG